MRLADFSTAQPGSADVAIVSELNQSVYQRLKLLLNLNLRRQIFLAVCEDFALRDQLAAQLQAELAYPNANLSNGTNALDGKLITLTLDLNQPNPIAQVNQWLTHHAAAKPSASQVGFQILGVEHLTRQPAPVQQWFLQHLQQLGRSCHALDSTLILWLNRPWLLAIQQSAPTFWKCHTALFEFEGDPTPIAATPTTQTQPCKRSLSHRNGASARQSPPKSAPVAPSPVHNGAINPVRPANGSDSNLRSSKADLWEILAQDLSTFDDRSVEPTLDPATPDRQISDRQISDSLVENDRSPNGHTAKAEPILVRSTPVNLTEPLSETTALVSTRRPAATVNPIVHPPIVHPPIVQSPIAQSITHPPEITRLLQQLEQLHQQQAAPEILAGAYQTLGNLFRDRIEPATTTEPADKSEQNLIAAIQAYEQTLNLLSKSAPAWAEVGNDLGNLYWLWSRRVAASEQCLLWLERAIAAYETALQSVNAATQPVFYAMIQNNLGSAYGELVAYRPAAEALQRSILAYEAALTYRTPEDDPVRYAATQNNLGTTYWNLAQHQQPIANLQRAIAAYTEALRFPNPANPSHHAMIQNNLGTTYWNLAQHEPTNDSAAANWLLQAIAAYETALIHRTLTDAPIAYAATQNNLGTAYWHLGNLVTVSTGDRLACFKAAITAYEASLTAIHSLQAAGTMPTLSFDPFAAHNNLGLAYHQLGLDSTNSSPKARSSYLEAALSHHLHALAGWAQQPDFHQSALNYIVQTVRAFYTEFGIKGQNLALARVPAHLLPELMRRL
jgi:hypothetical protein